MRSRARFAFPCLTIERSNYDGGTKLLYVTNLHVDVSKNVRYYTAANGQKSGKAIYNDRRPKGDNTSVHHLTL